MVPAGDTPKATRRRLRAFVVTALVVLAIVGFWPLRGYRIDDERFVEGLGFPNLSTSEWWFLPSPNPRRSRFAIFVSVSQETNRKSRESFDGGSKLPFDVRDSNLPHEPVPGLGVPAYQWRDFGDVFLIVRFRNLIILIRAVPGPDQGGMTDEEFARECLAAVLDGIDREIPGVTTFYNPPARQLWIDRGKPAFEKIKGRFRKMFAP